MPRRYVTILVLGSVGLCLLCGWVYNLPPVHDRLAWRVDSLPVSIKRYFNPPEEVVFTPQEQIEVIVQATLTALAPTPTSTALPQLTETPLPPPSATPTPIPDHASLSGIRHEYQQFNNCADSAKRKIEGFRYFKLRVRGLASAV